MKGHHMTYIFIYMNYIGGKLKKGGQKHGLCLIVLHLTAPAWSVNLWRTLLINRCSDLRSCQLQYMFLYSSIENNSNQSHPWKNSDKIKINFPENLPFLKFHIFLCGIFSCKRLSSNIFLAKLIFYNIFPMQSRFYVQPQQLPSIFYPISI